MIHEITRTFHEELTANLSFLHILMVHAQNFVLINNIVKNSVTEGLKGLRSPAFVTEYLMLTTSCIARSASRKIPLVTAEETEDWPHILRKGDLFMATYDLDLVQTE